MGAYSRQVIADFALSLIEEGIKLKSTAYPIDEGYRETTAVDYGGFCKWESSCKLLLLQLGTMGEPWKNIIDDKERSYGYVVDAIVGALQSIAENVVKGRLSRFEDIVFAEAFSNLFDQGIYLLEKNFHLAAGVIFRAVLEEKLRRMCDASGCTPSKARPTMVDYNQALYAAKVTDRLVFKSVDDMAAVGNDAAHNKPGLQAADIERLKTNLQDFLARN